MATYTVDLTPANRTMTAEGALDTSVVGGNSIQRTQEAVLVVNGANRKQLYRLADGETYDDTSFPAVSSNLPIGNPTFAAGTPTVANDNVTIGHPTASVASGSTF